MVNSDTTTNGRNIEMSAVGSSSIKDQSKATFWKKNAQSVPGSIKPVYGAQHPPRQEPILGASHMAQGTPRKDRTRTMKDSFQDFQDNTKDAWDDGDDDLILMANVRLSRKDVHNTAMQVLENHSQQMREAAARGVTLRPSLSESLDDGSTPQHHSHSSNSAPSTPSHLSGHRGNGPGLGVRLNTHWKVPKTNPLTSGQLPIPDRESSKIEKFKSLFEASAVTIEELRKISWSGIPVRYRPTTWKILSGYLPANTERRELTLRRKRQEYYGFLEHYYDKRKQDFHQETFRQISIDIPRMSPLIALFQQDTVQRIFERILYIWAIRHPASGYVQGINDLVTPFFVVFLTEYMNPAEKEVDTFEVASLPEASIRQLEADSFWCFSKLLDGIQDNYTFAQPGIQTKVHALQELVSRIDSKLHTHLEEQHVEYLQFSFRWMNNLLMREIPLHCIIRLWDTYLSETDGFALFHLYVCAAFLTHFSQDLKREHDFQGLMLMLQSLPTHSWHNEEIGLLLAEAFKLKFMFADAPKHLDHKK